MVTVGDGLGPNGAANRFLRLFVLANTRLHVRHARWGRRVLRRHFGLFTPRSSIHGHSMAFVDQSEGSHGRDLRLYNGHRRNCQCESSLQKDRSPSCEILRIGEKKWDRRSARAHSLRRSPCRRRPLCVHSSTRESLFVSMSAMSASFTVAPVRHAQAIRRSRKATGKVSVRRGVVAKAVEAAPKLVTTKSEAVSSTISRARYLPRTPRISSRSYQPRGGGRGGARRG